VPSLSLYKKKIQEETAAGRLHHEFRPHHPAHDRPARRPWPGTGRRGTTIAPRWSAPMPRASFLEASGKVFAQRPPAPAGARFGLREIGLGYAADPSIAKHLAISSHAKASPITETVRDGDFCSTAAY